MAFLRAALISVALLSSSASTPPLMVVPMGSGALHSGQRLAKPGLSGFSSNSSPHTTQILMGKGIFHSNQRPARRAIL